MIKSTVDNFMRKEFIEGYREFKESLEAFQEKDLRQGCCYLYHDQGALDQKATYIATVSRPEFSLPSSGSYKNRKSHLLLLDAVPVLPVLWSESYGIRDLSPQWLAIEYAAFAKPKPAKMTVLGLAYFLMLLHSDLSLMCVHLIGRR